jgi:hypothetical protein
VTQALDKRSIERMKAGRALVGCEWWRCVRGGDSAERVGERASEREREIINDVGAACNPYVSLQRTIGRGISVFTGFIGFVASLSPPLEREKTRARTHSLPWR